MTAPARVSGRLVVKTARLAAWRTVTLDWAGRSRHVAGSAARISSRLVRRLISSSLRMPRARRSPIARMRAAFGMGSSCAFSPIDHAFSHRPDSVVYVFVHFGLWNCEPETNWGAHAPRVGGVAVQRVMGKTRRAPTHTRPQTRKRQGAWSVDTGRGQRGVQSDVRRDGDGRRRGLLRRGARGRPEPEP